MKKRLPRGSESAQCLKSGGGSKARNACLALVDGGVELMFVDGHDDAIIGVGLRDGVDVTVHDSVAIIRTLGKRDGVSTADAAEFFACNIEGSWLGETTPIFMRPV